MSVRINNQNQAINNNKKKQIENSKNNKPSGSSAYSKNKKFLDKMLREYQAFCKKYFGESTPIGSMTEERMNKLLEEDNSNNNINKNNLIKNQNGNEKFSDIFTDDNKFTIENEDIFDELPIDINYSENDRLGNHKNTKNDYKRRTKAIFKEEKKVEEKGIDIDKKKEEEKVQEKNINKSEDEYDDFEGEENIEEIKNQKATKIQKVYRDKKIRKIYKNKIYFGNDKNKNNILWIYFDKLDSKENIISIEIKGYSMINKNNFILKKNIKDLLGVESISKEEIKNKINDILDKIEKMLTENEQKIKSNELNKNINNKKNNDDEEKVVDDDGEEYTF